MNLQWLHATHARGRSHPQVIWFDTRNYHEPRVHNKQNYAYFSHSVSHTDHVLICNRPMESTVVVTRMMLTCYQQIYRFAIANLISFKADGISGASIFRNASHYTCALAEPFNAKRQFAQGIGKHVSGGINRLREQIPGLEIPVSSRIPLRF